MIKLLKSTMSIMLAAALTLSIAACGQKNDSDSKSQESVQSTSTSVEVTSEPKKMGPLDKYESTVTINAALWYYASTKLGEGMTYEKNIWTDGYLNDLNIDVKYKFTAADQPYLDKVNVSIASADIPDAFVVNKDQFAKLLKTDLLADDLTQVLNDNASDMVKTMFNADGGVALSSATVNGKLKALPKMNSSLDRASVLYLRNDWLRKLGLQAPKTVDELVAVLKAFTNQDPDGNGKKDTIGLVGSKTLFLDFAAFSPIFEAYGANPRIWVEKDGKLVYGDFMPEMKKGLAKLAEMYKEGLIDKEFGIKDFGKSAEYVINGKCGAFMGNITLPMWPIGPHKSKENTAEWGYYSVVSGDVQPKVTLPDAIESYYVVSKDCKNPEAVVKMINYFAEKMWGQTAEPAKYQGTGDVSVHHVAPFQIWDPVKNYNAWKAVKAAVAKKDPTGLNEEQKDYYDKCLKWLDNKEPGDNYFNPAVNDIFNTPSTYDIVDSYVKGGLLMNEKFTSAATPTMTSKLATIQKMLDEAIVKIVMGASPVDSYDKTIEEVMKIGGQQMTDEVNQWYQKN